MGSHDGHLSTYKSLMEQLQSESNSEILIFLANDKLAALSSAPSLIRKEWNQIFEETYILAQLHKLAQTYTRAVVPKVGGSSR